MFGTVEIQLWFFIALAFLGGYALSKMVRLIMQKHDLIDRVVELRHQLSEQTEQTVIAQIKVNNQQMLLERQAAHIKALEGHLRNWVKDRHVLTRMGVTNESMN